MNVKLKEKQIELLELFINKLKKEYHFYKEIVEEEAFSEVITINSDKEEIDESLRKLDNILKMFSIIEKLKIGKYNVVFNIYLENSISELDNSYSFFYSSEEFQVARKKFYNSEITVEELREYNKLGRGGRGGGLGAGGGSYYQYFYPLTNFITEFIYKVEYYDKLINNFVLLEKIAHIENNITIIGANGSGKSTLSRQLNMDHNENGISIIPSQHYLYISDEYYLINPDGNHLDIEPYQNNEKLHRTNGSTDDMNHINELNKLINKLLIDHYANHGDTERVFYGENETMIEKVIRLWNEIINKHELVIINGVLKVKTTDGSIFLFNQLSDGERQVFYFLASSLLSNGKPYMIIDEPENHLNPQVSKRLWDIIEEEIDLTQIVHITHDPDFATSRQDSTLIWSKSYTYPADWKFEIVEAENLPQELLIEVLGSKTNVLLCEGGYDSLDYKIYNSIYEDYKIIPVGGHRQVIQYVKILQKMEQLNIEVRGIIDGDSKNQEIKDRYKINNIYHIDVNEIEMLFLAKPVIKRVLENWRDITIDVIDIDKTISDFETKFLEKIHSSIDKIVLEIVKRNIENILENEKIQSYKTIDEVQKEMDRIFKSAKPDDIYTEFKDIIDLLLREKNYKKMLNYCNLREEVTKGLINKQLMIPGYEQQAIKAIIVDKQLQSELRGEYIPSI